MQIEAVRFGRFSEYWPMSKLRRALEEGIRTPDQGTSTQPMQFVPTEPLDKAQMLKDSHIVVPPQLVKAPEVARSSSKSSVDYEGEMDSVSEGAVARLKCKFRLRSLQARNKFEPLTYNIVVPGHVNPNEIMITVRLDDKQIRLMRFREPELGEFLENIPVERLLLIADLVNETPQMPASHKQFVLDAVWQHLEKLRQAQVKTEKPQATEPLAADERPLTPDINYESQLTGINRLTGAKGLLECTFRLQAGNAFEQFGPLAYYTGVPGHLYPNEVRLTIGRDDKKLVLLQHGKPEYQDAAKIPGYKLRLISEMAEKTALIPFFHKKLIRDAVDQALRKQAQERLGSEQRAIMALADAVRSHHYGTTSMPV